MVAYTLEELADVVPNEDTFMSQICKRIFTFDVTTKSPEYLAVVESTCQNWFTQAQQHCKKIIFAEDTTTRTWLVDQIYNFGNRIFATQPAASLESTLPHIKVNPSQLQRDDCINLFTEMTEDYIKIAPKYSCCIEDNFFSWSILKGAICVLLIALLYLCSRGWKVKRRSEFHKKPVESNINPKTYTILEKWRILSKYSLRKQDSERKPLTLLRMLYDPTIAIRVMKSSLSRPFCSLEKSDSVQLPVKKDGAYLLDKFNVFFNKTAKCRLIIEINLDVSDLEEEEEVPKMRTRFSAGDYTASDDTTDDSDLETN